MSEPTNADALLAERNWLENLLTLRATVGDAGVDLALGQAEISYGRITGYWRLIVRPDLALAASLPQSALGGLHPELRARITQAGAVLADFDRENAAWVGTADAAGLVRPDYPMFAMRLAGELRGLLEIIERNPS